MNMTFISFRVNPTNQHGSVKQIKSTNELYKYFTETDDRNVLCTKEMSYLRKCWILNQPVDEDIRKGLEASDKKCWVESGLNKISIESPNLDYDEEEKPLEFECCKIIQSGCTSFRNRIMGKLNFNKDFSEQDQQNIEKALRKIQTSFPGVSEVSITNEDYSTHFIFKEADDLITTYTDLVSTVSVIEKDGRFSSYSGQLTHDKNEFLNESLQYLYDNNPDLFRQLMQEMQVTAFNYSMSGTIIDDRLVSVYNIYTRRGRIVLHIFTERKIENEEKSEETSGDPEKKEDQ